MHANMIVLGCVAQKGRHAVAAQDLYTSQLWKARRGYAEGRGRPWRIFSAKYGLIHPSRIISPYDVTLTDPGMADWRLEISGEVARAIAREDPRCIELHAGEEYCVDLVLFLLRRDIEVIRPLEGLGIGEQLAWYAERAREWASVATGQLDLFGGAA